MMASRSKPAQEIASAPTIDRAIRRVLTELHDGLRHGHFEFTVVCEVISQERRRLIVKVGKSYQFVIPKAECAQSTVPPLDSPDGSDIDAT